MTTPRLLALVVLLVGAKASEATALLADEEFDSLFSSKTLILEVADKCLPMTIFVARTRTQKQRGLMFVRSMPENVGMLFVYPDKSTISMWMKNTIIPLDIIFLDGSGGVINVAADTVPYSLNPVRASAPGSFALELNAGAASELGIRAGMRLFIPDLQDIHDN